MRVAADAERDHRRDLCAGSLTTSNRVMMVPLTVTEEAVSARLRSPSTASFPWSPEVKVTVGRDCIFHAQAYADASKTPSARPSARIGRLGLGYAGNGRWFPIDVEVEGK